jgi:SAM-dependent methyltransferase
MDRNDPAYKGQSGYNRLMLAVYDPLVLRFVTRAVWKTSTSDGVELYRRHMGRRHLDVGPGTGYFIEKAAQPGVRLTLVDPNPTVLAHCARRLAALNPTTVEADVMKPLSITERFDSAALSFVLHCLPGPQARKAVAVANVAALLEPHGVLFGGTVLGLTEQHSRPARMMLKAFNRQHAFDNEDDSAEGLREILQASFEDVAIAVVGSTALFTAARPRSQATA